MYHFRTLSCVGEHQAAQTSVINDVALFIVSLIAFDFGFEMERLHYVVAHVPDFEISIVGLTSVHCML